MSPASHHSLWCPPGYVPISEMVRTIRRWVESGAISDPDLVEVLGDRNGMPDPLVWGPQLLSGNLRSAAICSEDGALIALTPQDWRRGGWQGDNYCTAVEAACLGIEIFGGSSPPYIRCRGIVSEHDLAKSFGHTHPPPLPKELPEEWIKGNGPNKSDMCTKFGQADSQVVRLPQRDSMDAAEVLSWIAFRRSHTLEEWDTEIYGLSRSWPFSAAAFYNSNLVGKKYHTLHGGPPVLMNLLLAESSGLGWQSAAEFFSAEGSVPWECMHDLLIEDSANGLHQKLTKDVQRAATINPLIQAAASSLRRCLERGEIRALSSVTDREGWPMTQRTYVDRSKWTIAVEIFPDGTAKERGHLEVASALLFDKFDVLATWPASSNSGRVLSDEQEIVTPTLPQDIPAPTGNDETLGHAPPRGSQTSQDVLNAWMHGYADPSYSRHC